MKVKGNTHGMSFSRAKTHPIGRSPLRKFSFPFCAVGMKIMIFQTETHPLIEFETQAGECLVGKHRVGIRAVHRGAADLDLLGIDHREGGANSTPTIRNQSISMGALKADVEEQRHI